jgi:hypothetical protein
MKDYDGLEGTMSAARALVGHFSSSPQAQKCVQASSLFETLLCTHGS